MSASLQLRCTCGRPTSAVRCTPSKVVPRLAPLRCEASSQPARSQHREQQLNPFPALLAAAAVALTPAAAVAVSGGGGLGTSLAYKDFAGKDFQSQKFYKADLRGTNFKDANLTGANLFGAFAKDANFSGANLKLAVLESVDFDNADLSNAILEGAQITNARFQKTNIENTDWTDVLVRKDQLKVLCQLAKGTNPKTGVDTRESLMCS